MERREATNGVGVLRLEGKPTEYSSAGGRGIQRGHRHYHSDFPPCQFIRPRTNALRRTARRQQQRQARTPGSILCQYCFLYPSIGRASKKKLDGRRRAKGQSALFSTIVRQVPYP